MAEGREPRPRGTTTLSLLITRLLGTFAYIMLVRESHRGQSHALLPSGGTSSHVPMGVKNDPPTDEEINSREQKMQSGQTLLF